MELLKRIINIVYFVDIDDKSRKRHIVDARKAYAKILRDAGYSFEYIGRTINKDHASIIHYINCVDTLLKYDLAFEEKFILAKKHFLKEHKYSKKDIYAIAIDLERKLVEIKSIKEELQNILNDCKSNKGRDRCIDYCQNVILPLLDD